MIDERQVFEDATVGRSFIHVVQSVDLESIRLEYPTDGPQISVFIPEAQVRGFGFTAQFPKALKNLLLCEQELGPIPRDRADQQCALGGDQVAQTNVSSGKQSSALARRRRYGVRGPFERVQQLMRIPTISVTFNRVYCIRRQKAL